MSAPRWLVFLSFFVIALSLRAATCESLRSIALSHTTITTAEGVPAGAFHPPYGDTLQSLPAFCRVAGIIAPSSDSVIRFEVWLPANDWNSRYMGVANGGFAGSIDYRQLGRNLRNGYATAATDTGHEGGGEDATWAYHHPEKLVDFGHRAIHETAVTAKALIGAFYDHPARYSYFDGCSNGGRQALMEAQRYPEDYDGILAGAPANYWTHLLAGRINALKLLLADPAGYIPVTKLPAIAHAVEAACDAADGSKDGILANPQRCHFDPATLLCKGMESRSCLTAPQVKTLAALYADSRDKSGHLLFPGFVPGAELGQGGWGSWILGDGPGGSAGSIFFQSYLRYIVFEDPTLNTLTVDQETTVRRADAKTASVLNATDPDLSKFAARGGKLILYHGWNDPAISALNTINYFESVQHQMGAAAVKQFSRLYMMPGVQHCFGGPGPSAAGQFGAATAKGDRRGLDAAVEHWVEQKEPPGEIYATKYEGDNTSGKVLMTRPLCAYPSMPKYKGSGDLSDGANFACVTDQ